MKGEWKTVRVQDIAKRTATGPFGSAISSKHFLDSGVPVIRGSNLSQMISTRFDDSGLVFISEEKAEEFKRSEVRHGELVFTCWGTIDQVGLIDSRAKYDRYIVSNKQMLLTPDESRADSLFLYYYFASSETRAKILNEGIGSSVPGFNLGQLRSFEILLPPLVEQKVIAAVLGALDDKIELNRRMNVTLEAMARALFQSWFVDFDPVRAKLDGRQPVGMDEASAALFPDSFDETEFGHIPHGWSITTLGEICEKGGGNIQTGPFGTQLHASDYVDEGIPSIMPSDLRDNRIETSSIARIREEDAERLKVYRVQAGDVVYSRRGDVERRSLIRRSENGWLCGTGCLRVRFGPRGLNPFFGASYLGTLESRAWVVRHAVGATMPNLNTSILGALPMVVPPPELQARFAEIVGPWDECGTISLHQSCTLATLRDTLLSKLLSGELSFN